MGNRGMKGGGYERVPKTAAPKTCTLPKVQLTSHSTQTHTPTQQLTHTHVQAISHNYHVHAMGPLGTKGNREPTNGPGGGTKHDQLDHMFCKKLHYKSSGGSGGGRVDRVLQFPRNSIGPLG